MKWFLPFLAFIFIGELIAKYEYALLHHINVGFYYLIAIAESIFYSFIFYQLSNKSTLKKATLFFAFNSVAAYIIGFIFFRNDHSYFLPSLIISGFCFAVIALWYIYLKFVTDDDETLLINDPGFWIALGVSLFFSGTSIVFSLYNVIAKNNLNLFGIKLYNFVPRILCIVLYASISIAIILCKKKKTISS